ncbi:hypothetical protein S7711_10245, partial [Stachybotrys chartarum IBT 7711]
PHNHGALRKPASPYYHLPCKPCCNQPPILATFPSDAVQRKHTNNGRTFRVRGIPADWDTKRLASLITETFDLVPTISSLAQEIQSGVQSATVSFQAAPDVLRMLGLGRSIPLPRLSNEKASRRVYLQLDADFHGMTTLFVPPEDDHRVENYIVSLHSQASAATRLDLLSNEQVIICGYGMRCHTISPETTGRPMARVVTFGYESGVAGSNNIQNLEDLGTMLHNSLLPLISSPIVRPVIFIAHSLGGLIVKQALISLSKSKNEEDQRLLQAVYGIVFFGVPHDGMDITSLIPMVGDGPNRFLLESLSRINSQILSIQQREFELALGGQGDSEIVCFYETEESPTAQQDSAKGWAMEGPRVVLVAKASATHGRSWENGPEHICAVARTHSNMVKFSPHDPEYDKVRDRLRGLAQRALSGGCRIQGSNSHFIVPYPENRYNQPIGKNQARVSLYGLGGIGKTQIALAYVYRIHEVRKDVSVFWVHASNAERFRQSLETIAQECQIPGYEDPKKDILLLVKGWLERKDRGQWVMVLDNADDIQLFFPPPLEATSSSAESNHGYSFSDYLPECAHGALLVTTRNKQLGVKLSKGQRIIEVVRMDEHESEHLLRAKSINASSTDLLSLSARLEHLPLALVQAAAYIQEMSITVAKYLRLIGDTDQHMIHLLSKEFETVGRDSKAPRAVAQTWVLSFQQIEQQHVLASELLSFMSLLDRQDIPAKFLLHYTKQRESEEPLGDIELTEALGVLKAFSFVTEDNNGSYDMHRLVQLVTRKWLANCGTVGRFGKEALLILSHLYPYGTYETRTTCGAYLSHANAMLQSCKFRSEEEAEAKASLLRCMAGYFSFEGKWSDAEGLNIEATRIRRELFGESNPSTLESMANLASTFWNQGRWKEAESLQVKFREQDYTYDEAHSEVHFNRSGLVLHIGEPVKCEGWTQIRDPRKLFR